MASVSSGVLNVVRNEESSNSTCQKPHVDELAHLQLSRVDNAHGALGLAGSRHIRGLPSLFSTTTMELIQGVGCCTVARMPCCKRSSTVSVNTPRIRCRSGCRVCGFRHYLGSR